MSNRKAECMVQSQEMSLETELAMSVDPAVATLWGGKIQAGIIPIKLIQEGFDSGQYRIEGEKFSQFEADVFEIFCDNLEISKPSERKPIHYFGVGVGGGLEKVTSIANRRGYAVVAYDVSGEGCANAKQIFENMQHHGKDNLAFQADIEFACRRRFINEKNASKFVASRVVSILDKQDRDWQKKPVGKRKMARTTRRLGKMLRFLDGILLIHPEVDLDAMWGETTPHSLEEVKQYMEEGLGEEVEMKILGQHFFYHAYFAVQFRRISSKRGRTKSPLLLF